MKSIKQGLAVLLAVLLMTPTLPAKAEAIVVSDGDAVVNSEEVTISDGDASDAENEEVTVSDNNASDVESEEITVLNGDVSSISVEVASTSSVAGEVLFNTGNYAFSIVDASISDKTGDSFFEEDGSYTINIPEDNPFFPYEVQFTCNGEVTNEWFMTPDDSVEIGGHTFYVSAYFDNTVMTQMTLDIAGKKVVVYPEEKEFNNDGGVMPLSLLPLEERYLRVDLTQFTPVELTMVSVDSIFAGDNAVADTDKIIWKMAYNDDEGYTVSTSGDTLDLSCNTCYNSNNSWEMIVGEADQLAADNIRYRVIVSNKSTQNWLVPTAYIQDNTGVRTNIGVKDCRYYDYSNREVEITLSNTNLGNERKAYIGLSINSELYSTIDFSSFKVFEGKFATAQEAMSGIDITSQLFAEDMTQKNAGYLVNKYTNTWVTMVTFDENGYVTGCLPFSIYWRNTSTGMSIYSLYKLVEDDRYDSGYRNVYVNDNTSSRWVDGCYYYIFTLYKDYPANELYYQRFRYEKDGVDSSESVTAAYVGNYATIAEAVAVGATDIKADLFAMSESTSFGYGADYSQGVDFTIFIGEDGTEEQEIYHYNIKTENGSTPAITSTLSSGTAVSFTGLYDANGNYISAYTVDKEVDSYAEFNYLTILVDENADLSNMAPTFSLSNKVKLYAAGGSAPEESGKSYHDFSQGPVQYTASAEDGETSKNYWLQIVKAEAGDGKLYINSFADDAANTKVENDVTCSTREMMLDGYHNYVHDIWLANIGTEKISYLSVELSSDTVELDEYWTLSGNHDLAGLSTVSTSASYGELPNLAKVRVKAKQGVEDGTEISGTLTFKSGDKTLAVLTLTGIIGDPSITTEEIPEAVKFVPYGTMIQNNNKYSWNKVSYEFLYGSLPEGMEIKSNGEIYGVPAETGDFTFTVRMENSSNEFDSDEATYTLKIVENTDANVEAATDDGYDLSQKVGNFDVNDTGSQTLVSHGEYAEFVALYLDGVQLEDGTDYASEEGSTRITILNQTLAQKGLASTATHTLGMEFRTKDADILKRAAQNYTIAGVSIPDDENGNSGSSSSGDDSSGSDSGESNDSNADSVSGVDGSSDSKATSANAQAITYTIQSGDTLWKIAVKYLGTGDNWTKIYEDNKSVISDPNKIFEGQVIVIRITPSDVATTTISAATTTVGNTYTVKTGDSLWKIAKEIYGAGWKWKKIYNANQSVVSSPESIYAGQVIVIPE